MRREKISGYGPDFILITSGTASTLLGVIVLIGWYTHNLTLLQISPDFIPMHYHTALGFLLCGLGLWSIILGRPRGAMVCGGIILLIGFFTLIQNIFNIDLGKSGFAIKLDTQIDVPYPIAMASSTALCFVFTGVVLLLMGIPLRVHQRPFILGLLSCVIGALGIITLLGYFLNMKELYGWWRFMAIHTAAGFIILSAGIFAFAWQDSRTDRARLWLPIPIGIGSLTIGLIVWQALLVKDHAQIQHIIDTEARIIKNQITSEIKTRILGLVHIANDWEREGKPVKAEWESHAKFYIDHYPGYQAVEMGGSFILRAMGSTSGRK